MFVLAGHLGKTVAWIERNMSMRELVEWSLFAAMEPIGGYRIDVNTASIVAELRASMQAFAGKSEPVKLSDCMLTFAGGTETQNGEPRKTVEQMKTVLSLALRAQEAHVKRHKRHG